MPVKANDECTKRMMALADEFSKPELIKRFVMTWLSMDVKRVHRFGTSLETLLRTYFKVWTTNKNFTITISDQCLSFFEDKTMDGIENVWRISLTDELAVYFTEAAVALNSLLVCAWVAWGSHTIENKTLTYARYNGAAYLSMEPWSITVLRTLRAHLAEAYDDVDECEIWTTCVREYSERTPYARRVIEASLRDDD